MNRAVLSGLVCALLLGATGWLAPAARGEPCRPLWQADLDTDPSTPAPANENVDTAYAEFYFFKDPGTKLVLTGHFPMVRFISFQAYTSVNLKMVEPEGVLFDYQIAMDADGSVNPYVPGNPVGPEHPHNYTIEILPKGAPAASANVLRMGSDPFQSVMIRFYSPDEGITLGPADLPEVRAHHVASGRPAPCPRFVHLGTPSDPTPCGNPDPTALPFSQVAATPRTTNAAVPSYLAACSNAMAQSAQVAIVRFRPPTFVNTHYATADPPEPGTFPDGLNVRYWSLSVGDPATSMTINGLADFAALPPEADGGVTVVVGPESVRATASARGHNFLLDARDPAATSMLFVVRNVLPAPEFWNGADPYPQDHWPTGVVCAVTDYLGGSAACVPPPLPASSGRGGAAR